MNETSVKRKRKLLKPTVLTLLALVVVTICAVLPKTLFEIKDKGSDGKFSAVSGMDGKLGQEESIKNANSVISAVTTFIPTGEETLITNEELRSHYLYRVVQNQLVELVDNRIIQPPLYDQLMYGLVEKEDLEERIEVYLAEPLEPEEPYEWIVVSNRDKLSLNMLYDKEREKAIQMTFTYDEEYQYADIYPEEAMKNYISWLGLEGIMNWKITDSSSETSYYTSAKSPNIPLDISISKSVITDDVCNLSYYVAGEQKRVIYADETEVID